MHTWCTIATAIATATAVCQWCCWWWFDMVALTESDTGRRGSHVVNICMMDDVDAIESHRYGRAHTHPLCVCKCEHTDFIITLKHSVSRVPHIAYVVYYGYSEKKKLITIEVDHHFSYIICTQIHTRTHIHPFLPYFSHPLLSHPIE